MHIDDVIASNDGARMDERLLERLKKIKGREKRRVKLFKPASQFPELIVEIPKHWPYVDLAPLYDVHLGHRLHDTELFRRHWRWLRRTPYVLTFDGGDFIENASKLSVGNGVYEQREKADEQAAQAAEVWSSLWHKMLFKLPGNHEARTQVLGVDVSAWLCALAEIPYFPDFCFCTIKFRDNNFRLIAHHGTGAATTAGAQRNAARKPTPWANGWDILWTGHLHNPLADPVAKTDFDQKTNRVVERDGMVVISPSYLKYFGGYAATKMYPLGLRGLHVIRLNPDGRIDCSIHARGERL